jgi:hypothetical protein
MNTRAHRWRQAWRPWTGWLGGLSGWFLSQQFGTSLAQDACASINPLTHGLIGLAGLSLAGLGIFFSSPVWRNKAPPLEDATPQSRAFIAVCGAGAALIFSLAIIFQTLSPMVIPPCYS